MNGDFLDTNVIVYLFDETAPDKHATARLIVTSALDNGSGVVSFQVVQETLNVLTRKLRVVARPADARDFLKETLQPLWTVQPSAALYARALDLKDRLGFAFYDSLIVAAALEAGCKRLLSEDLQHGQRIDGLRIENPFRA
jgi:predicted nucleic acid-binding protein